MNEHADSEPRCNSCGGSQELEQVMLRKHPDQGRLPRGARALLDVKQWLCRACRWSAEKGLEDLLLCPLCGAVALMDGYDVLGADEGKLFCNACRGEHAMVLVELITNTKGN